MSCWWKSQNLTWFKRREMGGTAENVWPSLHDWTLANYNFHRSVLWILTGTQSLWLGPQIPYCWNLSVKAAELYLLLKSTVPYRFHYYEALELLCLKPQASFYPPVQCLSFLLQGHSDSSKSPTSLTAAKYGTRDISGHAYHHPLLTLFYHIYTFLDKLLL